MLKLYFILLFLFIIIFYLFNIKSNISTTNIKETIKNNIDYNYGPIINLDTLTWLQENSKNLKIQLPIEFHINEIGIYKTYLYGYNYKTEIYIDTTAMSIDLLTIIKPYCNKYTCIIWIEGTWNSLILNQNSEYSHTFSAYRVISIFNNDKLNVRLSIIN